jgi:hypothetical protein
MNRQKPHNPTNIERTAVSPIPNKRCNYVEFGCRDKTPPAYGQSAFRSSGKVWVVNPFAEKVTVPTRSDGTIICQDPLLFVVADCE